MIRRLTYINEIFQKLCLQKMCPIFVNSVHNLVSLTMTLFSEKVLISNRCISGLMSKLIKKSWMDSTETLGREERRKRPSAFLGTFFIVHSALCHCEPKLRIRSENCESRAVKKSYFGAVPQLTEVFDRTILEHHISFSSNFLTKKRE